ncbi:unnamed protein product [Sphenostylis stenocarpa]|uniref:Uncharacterized protein n=1 Tax=Sphenostylis stenocarpa TaxID=92480 RepID=A0AA86RVB3_9FABA|nr:unnamed protein product [Sphenostylis stenocarpa]
MEDSDKGVTLQSIVTLGLLEDSDKGPDKVRKRYRKKPAFHRQNGTQQEAHSITNSITPSCQTSGPGSE